MSYTTHFFAVDLGQIQAAIGSKDADLRKRLFEAIRANNSDGPTDELTVVATLDGEILFNGMLLTPEEFETELRNPKWEGGMLNCYQREATTPEEGQRLKASRFGKPGSFAAFLDNAISGLNVAGISWCSEEEDIYGDADGELSLEEAATHLLAGQFPEEETPYQYGFAFEYLCRVLGKPLGVIEAKRMLKHLKLESKLFESRSPVPLPDYDDFPYISYLNPDEVREEVQQLRNLNLAFPKDSQTEIDRRQFAAMLEEAAREGKAVITVYY